MNYEEHADVIEAFSDAQEADIDMREKSRECDYFVNKSDGQWEPEIVSRLKGKPRYTDDRVNPIVNQIAAELEQADFTIRVRPAGGEATKETAKLYDGLIRNIRNISKFSLTQNHEARVCVESGLGGWEITHDYLDNDSFDQDLIIEPLYNFVDRVWFLDGYNRDASDCTMALKLDYISPEEYDALYPDGSKSSLDAGSWSDVYYYKRERIIIGKFYYLKKIKTKLLRMSDGAIYREDDDFLAVQDELEEAGIFVEDERETEETVCFTRMMDAGGWLDDEEETVFNSIPIVPLYGNYKVSEGKIIYRGIVEKLMDVQRVHNYAFSRNVEEVALSPRQKWMMTKEQAAGHLEQLRTMNTNMDPVQFYNNVQGTPPPFYSGGAQANQATLALVQETNQAISQAAGVFAANMGDNPGLQSGVAIDRQIDRGNNATSPFFEAMKCAIIRTGQLLVKAIPKVYDATRQVRLLNEDGSFEQKIINQQIIDGETGEPITLNDLSVGKYDVVCDIGAKYKNRQKEAVDTILSIIQYDPSSIELARDVLFNNMNEPGFDKLSERARAAALQNGIIPLEQMTEEERANYEQEQAQAAEQPQGDPAAMQMAQAEMLKAQAEMQKAQNDQVSLQLDAQKLQLEAAKIQQARQAQVEKTQSETALNVAKIDQEQQKIDNKAQEVQAKTMLELQKQQIDMQKQVVDTQKTQAEILNLLKQAIGADAIMNPSTIQAYDEVSKDLAENDNAKMQQE